MTGSVSATDDFYVVFQGKNQQSIGIPEKQSNGDYNFDSSTLFIDSSTSQVGIGTSSPSGAKLQVTGSGYSEQLVVERTDTSSKFGLAGVESGGFQIYDVNSGDATRMIIDSSGEVLIGKTSADNSAGIRLKQDGEGYFVKNDGSPLAANRLSTDGVIQYFFKDTTHVGSIGTNGDKLYISNNTGTGGLRFYNGGVNPCDASGNESDNQRDLGKSSSRWNDLYLGGGVVFGDAGGSGTPTSNTLDSYEEGTWTPTLSVGTATTRRGDYTKIGNQVFFSVIVGAGMTTSGGTLKITNLPFTCTDTTLSKDGHHSVMSRYVNIGNVSLTGYTYNNSTEILFYKNGNNANDWSALNHSDLSSGSAYFRVSGFYTTDS